MSDRPGLGDAIPTGFARLDSALGTGGVPRGAMIEIFGPTCGKTTLALQIAAHLQDSGYSAAWIDADGTFDPAYASQLGVVLERLPVLRPDSAEQALEIACRLVASGGIDLLAVDPAAALTPELEREAAIGTSGPGLHGRVLASGLRRLSRAAARAGAAVLFVNQARTRLDTAAESSAGGPALKLYAALRIRVAPGPPRSMQFQVLKNRAGWAFREGTLEWLAGRGFSKAP